MALHKLLLVIILSYAVTARSAAKTLNPKLVEMETAYRTTLEANLKKLLGPEVEFAVGLKIVPTKKIKKKPSEKTSAVYDDYILFPVSEKPQDSSSAAKNFEFRYINIGVYVYSAITIEVQNFIKEEVKRTFLGLSTRVQLVLVEKPVMPQKILPPKTVPEITKRELLQPASQLLGHLALAFALVISIIIFSEAFKKYGKFPTQDIKNSPDMTPPGGEQHISLEYQPNGGDDSDSLVSEDLVSELEQKVLGLILDNGFCFQVRVLSQQDYQSYLVRLLSKADDKLQSAITKMMNDEQVDKIQSQQQKAFVTSEYYDWLLFTVREFALFPRTKFGAWVKGFSQSQKTMIANITEENWLQLLEKKLTKANFNLVASVLNQESISDFLQNKATKQVIELYENESLELPNPVEFFSDLAKVLKEDDSYRPSFADQVLLNAVSAQVGCFKIGDEQSLLESIESKRLADILNKDWIHRINLNKVSEESLENEFNKLSLDGKLSILKVMNTDWQQRVLNLITEGPQKVIIKDKLIATDKVTPEEIKLGDKLLKKVVVYDEAASSAESSIKAA